MKTEVKARAKISARVRYADGRVLELGVVSRPRLKLWTRALLWLRRALTKKAV